MKNKKIILDTNLWISFLISDKLNILDDLIEQKKVTLIFSGESIEEFLEVAKRPKFQKYFTNDQLEYLLSKFSYYGKIYRVKSLTQFCRDKKDNFLLNLAIDSKADYLLTGDADLLILKKIENTLICTWTDFIKHIQPLL